MTRVISCASVLLAVLTVLEPIPGHAEGLVPDYVASAIADPARPPAQVAHDAQRQPGEVLAFAGVRPGDRVADFMSGGAYFTRLFSRIVGNTGHVYAFLPEEQLKNCAPEETAGTRAIEHDGRWHDYQVALPAAGEIGVLRLDPGDGPGTICFEWLRVKRPDASGRLLREWELKNGMP